MVLEKLRGLRSEPAVVAQLRDHKWTSEEQKRELLEKFHAISKPDVEWIVWTALEPGSRDPGGGSRDPQEAPRPRRARSARSAPEDALGGRAARRHALPEGARGAAARAVSAGDRIPRRRLRAPRRSRAGPGASRRGGLRHRAPGAHRLEPRRARAGPEGRQRDELRGQRGRGGEPRRPAAAGRERGDPLLGPRRPREEPERELLPGRPPDGAHGRRARGGGLVRGAQASPLDREAGSHAARSCLSSRTETRS